MGHVTLEIANSVGTITINRPEVYNALNIKAKLEIIEALEALNRNADIRVILLTGAGKAFCSGQDLNDRSVDARQGPVDIGHTLETEWNPLVNAIRSSEKLVIGAINGVCAGAGLSVALACDVKIAAAGTRFIAGFTQIGLVPDAGLSFQLVRHLGYGRALLFALRGKPLLSEDLLEHGLLSEVHADPLARAKELASELAQLAPLAVLHAKRNFTKAQEASWAQNLETEKESQRFLGFSRDYREGVSAFLEKRRPEFKGE